MWSGGRAFLLRFLAVLFLAIGTASAETDEYRNSLGMVFRKVEGSPILFSAWETRLADWKAFVSRSENHWSHPPAFEQTDEHPVVNITLDEALSFCDWLTQVERASGQISPKQQYRLPANSEWDIAVGLIGATSLVGKQYPWGSEWPPPADAGDYDVGRIEGVKDDGFRFTAPVGRFKPSPDKLYDLGGNVWEWTVDDPTSPTATLRGGSWMYSRPVMLESGYRMAVKRGLRTPTVGFRCVLVDQDKLEKNRERNHREDESSRAELLARAKAPKQSSVPLTAEEELKRRLVKEGIVAAPGLTPPQPASQNTEFTNSTGMKLLPLRELGVLMAQHEVRVRDYQSYALAENLPTPQAAGSDTTPEHPVTNVSWTDATSFCTWLTRREQQAKLLPAGSFYRLPQRKEWQYAVLEGKQAKSGLEYPWGSSWPPEKGYANLDVRVSGSIYGQTSRLLPVKSYRKNDLGFYDLVGNAAEWCQETLQSGVNQASYCGGSWKSLTPEDLRLESAHQAPPTTRLPELGFRLVLDFSGLPSARKEIIEQDKKNSP